MVNKVYSKNIINSQYLLDNQDKFKNIFFYRVCGTGMGNAAILLKESGKMVEGGDHQFYPPMSTHLESSGIKLHKLNDISDEYLKTFDLIVVGNVVGRESEDASRIESLGVPLTSFPDALGCFILSSRNVIGISGTHGKTTTTYLLTQIFENFGLTPGYLVGGVIDDKPSCSLGSDSYFFIEADEYDSSYFQKQSKFHYYHLNHLILTSLEYDHADIFSSVEDIEDEFLRLIPNLSGKVVASCSYPSIIKIKDQLSNNSKSWSFFGVNEKIGPFLISYQDHITSFTLVLNDKKENFQTNLVGVHNILNLTSCIILTHLLGFKIDQIKQAIKDLKKVKRRQEIKGYYLDSLIIDDFAHHPTAVTLTLKGLKEQYPNKKIISVFAPTSATARSSIFEQQFSESLLISDGLIIINPQKETTVEGTYNLDCHKILSYFKERKEGYSCIVNNLQDLRETLDHAIMAYKTNNAENLVVIMSNGDTLGLWESDFIKQLK